MNVAKFLRQQIWRLSANGVSQSRKNAKCPKNANFPECG